jgi:hypothetical protein
MAVGSEFVGSDVAHEGSCQVTAVCPILLATKPSLIISGRAAVCWTPIS